MHHVHISTGFMLVVALFIIDLLSVFFAFIVAMRRPTRDISARPAITAHRAIPDRHRLRLRLMLRRGRDTWPPLRRSICIPVRAAPIY
jgi:hypothetical protein